MKKDLVIVCTLLMLIAIFVTNLTNPSYAETERMYGCPKCGSIGIGSIPKEPYNKCCNVVYVPVTQAFLDSFKTEYSCPEHGILEEEDVFIGQWITEEYYFCVQCIAEFWKNNKKEITRMMKALKNGGKK